MTPTGLQLGIEVPGHAIFEAKSDSAKTHTMLVGKSGCGKSVLMARLIEEMVLRQAGSVLLFDFNHEFSHFDQVDPKPFSNDSWNVTKDKHADFEAAWLQPGADIQHIEAKSIRIAYSDLSLEERLLLLADNAASSPGTVWMLDQIEETEGAQVARERRGLRRAVETRDRWRDGRLKANEDPILASQIRARTDGSDVARLLHGAQFIENCKNLAFGAGAATLQDAIGTLLDEPGRFLSLDVFNFARDKRGLRDFILLYALDRLWTMSKERFRINGGSSNSVFVVVDEAHNVIPNSPIKTRIAQEVADIFETIAAEGRKFGLFLVLVSQRPSKLNTNVRSECDNFFLMNSGPEVASLLEDIVPVNDSEKSKLSRVRGLERNHAIVVGKSPTTLPGRFIPAFEEPRVGNAYALADGERKAPGGG